MTRTVTKPGSVANDGNLVVLFVPTAGVVNKLAPTITELAAATVKDITYALTASGWNPSRSQDTVTDDRLTSPDVYEQPGRSTNQLSIQYVAGAADDTASATLAQGTVGSFYVRYAAPYTADFAVDDEWEVWPVVMGVPVWDAPTANGKWRKTQKPVVTGPVEIATAVAGS